MKRGWRRHCCRASKGGEIQSRSQGLHQGLPFLPGSHKISRAGASCLFRIFLKPPTSKTPLFLCFKVPLKSWNKFACLFSQTKCRGGKQKEHVFYERKFGTVTPNYCISSCHKMMIGGVRSNLWPQNRVISAHTQKNTLSSQRKGGGRSGDAGNETSESNTQLPLELGVN